MRSVMISLKDNNNATQIGLDFIHGNIKSFQYLKRMKVNCVMISINERKTKNSTIDYSVCLLMIFYYLVG